MKLTFDYHNHTPFSHCSKKDYTIDEMLQRMRAAGYGSVGFSDHYYADETDPAAYVRSIRAVAATMPDMEVFAGVEVDMLWPGHLGADAKTLTPYDYVAVACPHWHNPHVARPVRYTPEVLAQAQYDYLLSLAEIPFVDVVVHPFTFYSAAGYIPVDQQALMACYTTEDFDRLIDGLIKNRIAIELHANLKKPDYALSLSPFIRRCVSRGVHFSLGSDAHELRWVGSILDARDVIESFQIPDDLAFHPEKRNDAGTV